jgi:hypothetical protein
MPLPRIALAVAALVALAACEPPSSLLPPDLDEPALGKADAITIERIPADAPLGGAALKRLACDAIGPSATGARCARFRLRITEFGRSTLYLHAADGEPVTLELAVTATHADGATFAVILRRDRLVGHRLAWSATAADGDVHAAILALAAELGDVPDWGIAADRAVPIAADELPAAVAFAFDAALDSRRQDNRRSDPDAEAFLVEEAPFHALRRNGVTIGYAAQIDDFFDHPLWDGSGVTIYVDRGGAAVTDVEWSG